MQITILTVGKLKSGPEKQMVEDYRKRFDRLARSQGFRPINIVEVDSGGGLEVEGKRLLDKRPAGARLYRLDEHGKVMTSVCFANTLAALRDGGEKDLVFVIGGAEGFGATVQTEVQNTLAFGSQTWPHKLVRVMLCEQIYRAASVLAGHPYHKA